ncbi:MAG: GNAT family N-acetyltransferase [Candidatus Sumerlaeota bacterium]|nr:GNAT family N-acetyltransferase [Candidatus Sumerlaeota bacterium]
MTPINPLPYPAPSDLRIHDLRHLSDLTDLWNECDFLRLPNQISRKFMTGFAASDRMVQAALRLRYRVFNQEMGHGLSSAAETGMDTDQYDEQMSHLLLLDKESLKVIGTYRLQTAKTALKHRGLYSAQEYDLTVLQPLFASAVECGRACVAPEFRKANSLMALLSAFHVYLAMGGYRYLFGCCSVSSHDPDDGWRVMKTLRKNNWLHPEYCLPPTLAYSCGDPSREFAPDLGEGLALPKLFNVYMKLGPSVISLPAIDREFGTVDFLVMADAQDVNFSDWVIKP